MVAVKHNMTYFQQSEVIKKLLIQTKYLCFEILHQGVKCLNESYIGLLKLKASKCLEKKGLVCRGLEKILIFGQPTFLLKCVWLLKDWHKFKYLLVFPCR